MDAPTLKLFIYADLVLLLLLVMVFPFLERGSGSFYISIVTGAILVSALAVQGALLRRRLRERSGS